MNPQELRDALWMALFSKQDYAEAERLLDIGASLEATNIRGETAAIFAAQDHRLEALEWLAAKGANLNAQRADAQKETPLTLAVGSNNALVVKKLLELGADPTIANGRGITPLLQAFFGEIDKDRGIVQALIESGADLNARSEMGVTPAMVAATRGWDQWLGVLLDAGADPNVVDCMGQSLLHSAVSATNADAMIALILEKAPLIDLDLKTRNGATALALATNYGRTKVIQLLVEAGADVNVRANGVAEEMSPLMISASMLAAGQREASAIAEMQRRQDEAEAQQSKLQTQAAKQAGTLLNNPTGLPAAPTAPTSAPRHGNNAKKKQQALPQGELAERVPELAETVQKLIASGANVKERDLLGRSVGWHAAGVDLDTMHLLIANGLDPKEPLGPDGFTPYHAALLCPGDPAERDAKLRAYHQMGFSVNPPTWTGKVSEQVWPSPLLLAIRMGDPVAVETLMALGANPNLIEPSSGTTVLHQLAKLPFTAYEEKIMQILRSPLRSKIENADDEEKALLAEVKGRARRMTFAVSTQAGQWRTVDRDGDTPLGSGVVKGASPEWAEMMIFEFGARADNPSGRSAAVAALAAGRPDMALALTEIIGRQGGDPDKLFLDAAYDSPEGWELRMPFLQALRMMPAIPAQLDARDEAGNTPMIIAAATGQADLVDVFLAMGADPNAQNDAGETAIFQAAATGNTRAVRLLRSSGADLEILDGQGRGVRQVVPGMAELGPQYENEEFEVEKLPELELEHLQKMDAVREAWATLWDQKHPGQRPAAMVA